jgi:hypothetical protein
VPAHRHNRCVLRHVAYVLCFTSNDAGGGGVGMNQYLHVGSMSISRHMATTGVSQVPAATCCMMCMAFDATEVAVPHPYVSNEW